ncbi:hypothetical protein LI216_12415 [Mediterraneibacter glycyrrhizinilyticus]|uniref:hypothetical protein n=1 Tax=Mediterraneibacter glycyrrhizinilyticus TaxID=342942 RepID=UPI001D099D1B|nr:hypothetical protein [Mediterraneibacter glycyrrhizinilyticus]MCB6310369.1 hypothetical protein [Lachnospiraceae bacterium 210521-DFI.1.109]MCB6427869.1 hypothetical protein [Mediterraneibacter glycyrrhizinilyticus]
MFATHSIKKNGRWYKAGEEMDSPAEFMNPPEILEHEEKKITKTDIHRMPVEELRKLAEEQGIDGVEEMNGTDIKKLLLERIEA